MAARPGLETHLEQRSVGHGKTRCGSIPSTGGLSPGRPSCPQSSRWSARPSCCTKMPLLTPSVRWISLPYWASGMASGSAGYMPKQRGSCAAAGVGSGSLGMARDRSGPVGTARGRRDGSRSLGTRGDQRNWLSVVVIAVTRRMCACSMQRADVTCGQLDPSCLLAMTKALRGPRESLHSVR